MMNRAFKIGGVALACALAGCSTSHQMVAKDIARQDKVARPAMEQPIQSAPVSRVSEVRGAKTPIVMVKNVRTSDWLRSKKVALNVRQPVSLASVLETLSAQGINVSSDLRLSQYSFVGRINDTDAETALKIIMGANGLDFVTDDVRQVVVVRPMISRTWFLNIGNRKSNFTSETAGGSSLAATSGDPLGGTGGAGGGGGGGGTVGSGGTGQAVTGAGATVSSQDDFWASLSKELETRTKVLIPKEMSRTAAATPAAPTPLPGSALAAPGAASKAGAEAGAPASPLPTPAATAQAVQAAQPAAAQGGQGADGGLESRQIGQFSVNPETGSVTVQAPTYILNELDGYMKRVQEMYNTDITFSGEVILVTSNKDDSEGIDINAFAQFASGKLGFIVQNNALGGLTVSTSAGTIANVAAPNRPVGGGLAGVTYSNGKNALQLFNAFLSEHGNVSVVQRPLITTTSGVPGIFSKRFTDYYNTVSQEATAGTAGAAVAATTNKLIPVDFGTELRINPRIDVSTGLIRAQLTLNQALQSGTKTVQQTITAGANTVAVPTVIPIVSRQNLSGEILLKDGDLVIVGGQSEDTGRTTASGLPGQDGPLAAGILGVKQTNQSRQTYYFALRVSVNKRK